MLIVEIMSIVHSSKQDILHLLKQKIKRITLLNEHACIELRKTIQIIDVEKMRQITIIVIK